MHSYLVFDSKLKVTDTVTASSEEDALSVSADFTSAVRIYGSDKLAHYLAKDVLSQKLANTAGFMLCVGRERSIIALHRFNFGKKIRTQAPCLKTIMTHSILELVLEGVYFIRNFDGKYCFEYISAEGYIDCLDKVHSLNIKTMTFN